MPKKTKVNEVAGGPASYVYPSFKRSVMGRSGDATRKPRTVMVFDNSDSGEMPAPFLGPRGGKRKMNE